MVEPTVRTDEKGPGDEQEEDSDDKEKDTDDDDEVEQRSVITVGENGTIMEDDRAENGERGVDAKLNTGKNANNGASEERTGEEQGTIANHPIARTPAIHTA